MSSFSPLPKMCNVYVLIQSSFIRVILFIVCCLQVFADLPPHFIIDEKCLHQGKFVAEGAFGKIYQGILYPYQSATVRNYIQIL